MVGVKEKESKVADKQSAGNTPAAVNENKEMGLSGIF
jgi:hypothetical protein